MSKLITILIEGGTETERMRFAKTVAIKHKLEKPYRKYPHVSILKIETYRDEKVVRNIIRKEKPDYLSVSVN